MIKEALFLSAAVLTLGLGVPVSFAEDAEQPAPAGEERIEHYHVAAPQTKAEALALLKEKVAAIEAIIAQDKELDDPVDLESIHEVTYSFEVAVDKLRADAGESEKIDHLDEAVQALHYASESGDAEKTLEWFSKLKPLAAAMQEPKQKPEKQSFYEIKIKDHAFIPAELIVPAGEKIRLKVHNQDATPEEFESHDMNREKVIAGGKIATIFVGPLEPGKYHYFGEFNMDTANGTIIAE